MLPSPRPFRCGVIAAIILTCTPAALHAARTVPVSNASQLVTAVATAQPGDTIVLADGTYGGFTITRSGSVDAPIVIQAQNRGRATVNSGIIRLSQTSYVTVDGVTLTTPGSSQTVDGETYPVAVWLEGTNHCRITRSTFKLGNPASGTAWLMLSGNSNFNRVDHCEFGPNTVHGCHYIWPRGNRTIAGITPPSDRTTWAEGKGPYNPNMARDTQIDHNYFHDQGADTAETMVLGAIGVTGDYQDTRTTIEWNLFVNCDGDPEIISVKSSSNVLRYNTVRTSAGMFSLRAGNNSSIYGNFFFQAAKSGAGGIKLYEKNHTVYNNYIDNASEYSILIGAGDAYTSSSFSHAQVFGARIVHNTVVNANNRPVIMGHGSTLPPTDVVFANNLLQGSATLFSNRVAAVGNSVYAGNLASSSDGLPGSGFIVTDPRLSTINGLMRPTATSPGVDAGSATYAVPVTGDMDGQLRDSKPDIGADEISSAAITRAPLSTTDVGPNAPVDDAPPVIVNPPAITTAPAAQIVVAGATATFSVQASGTGLSYQWTFNGTAAANATSPVLTLTNVTTTQAGAYAVVVANGAGAVTSSSAALTVNPAPPRITQQPNSLTIANGGSVNFTVVASGTGLNYQWNFNGSSIAGATNATLTVANVSDANAGSYTVIVSNVSGSVTSAAATLTVTLATPGITAPPLAQTVARGDPAVLSVTAVGGQLSYQWQRDGSPIAGATGATYLARGTDIAGRYVVVITNSQGSATSAPVTITTTDPAPATRGRIVNLAIRSQAGAGAQTLIVGAVIGGPGTTGTKTLLIRAAGPALVPFGVANALADPVATVFSGATAIASNDGWKGDLVVATRAAAVGAFPFPSATSADAALVPPPLAPSAYTVQVSSKTSATGVALAEIYDADDTFTTATPRLINVSARTQVGTGANILIAGFVVGGTTGKTVLIRAVGPGLATFGVTDSLTNPKLELFRDSTSIATNDDWSGAPALTAAFTAVGAFPLDGASKDAALILTLPPGSYSAQVSGVGDTTGIGLVEIYEVP
jgi:poly(beta-D-mannuronate) lyase